MEVLLDAGARIEMCDNDGRSCIDLALAMNHVELIDLLRAVTGTMKSLSERLSGGVGGVVGDDASEIGENGGERLIKTSCLPKEARVLLCKLHYHYPLKKFQFIANGLFWWTIS